MDIFFRQLVLKLDSERKGWRKDTVILLDNATYHAAVSTMELFNGLDIPILFSGPHSYDAALCELLFAHFKRNDINQNHLPTGKTGFETVVSLVIRRFQEIKHSHRILFWHHCLLEAYKYLYFKRL